MLRPSWRARIGQDVAQAARWRPLSGRAVWVVVAVLVIVVGAEAVVIPARRVGLVCGAAGLIGAGLWVTGRRRQRRERALLATRLATGSGDDVPPDVIGLVAAGQKIRAIRRYRELTGATLQDAKVVIDSL